MIAYLEEWLRMRAGSAPVFVGFNDGTTGDFTMRAVDSVGIVLNMSSSSENGVSYPWTTIASVSRTK